MASTASGGTGGAGRPVVVVRIDGSEPSRAAQAWPDDGLAGLPGGRHDDSVHHATRPLVLVPTA